MASIVIVIAVALAIGFRPTASALEWLGVIGLLTLVMFALTWLSAAFGVTAQNPEAASNAPMPLLFLPLLGSAIVPTETMPTAMRYFAEYQPFTPIIETLRGLLMGTAIGDSWIWALGWCAVIGVGGYLWARAAFAREPALGHAVDAACTRGTGCTVHPDRTFALMGRGRPPQIVAYGGGGFSMEPGNPLLDDYVLSLCRRKKPRVCFFPSASGDADHYVVRFYRHFSSEVCDPSHISLFRRDCGPGAVREHLLKQDLIYVGGGSILSLLGVWRAHGIDEDLRAAWQAGVILVRRVGRLAVLVRVGADGLPPRREALRRASASCRTPTPCTTRRSPTGGRPTTPRCWTGCPPATRRRTARRCTSSARTCTGSCSSRPEARAYRVEAVGDQVIELPLEATYLGERPPIALAAA